MIILQNAMEKSNLFKVDEFGVKNYNYGALGLLSVVLFAVINMSLGYVTFVAETSVVGSPVKNYADAFWLMLMSSTTIGFGDVYPITLVGRITVFIMFLLGVGILGGVGAVFANKIFGFADTNIKNRELRKQNEEILQQNEKIYQKLSVLEDKLEAFNKEAK
ncbi:potassium channel family protein [Colwellia psychrerythraea]|uniref:Ion transport 2 domain protein n=1 Tax=Colwellia psychrerythraea TaxID=28229 RepID=A0A099KP62_COLPS|nr:potassium channel family protein [Colwellia psychrerythraea]KGJ92286.1 Ion transport 2 domain protein [Colwellia psychrerythraea]